MKPNPVVSIPVYKSFDALNGTELVSFQRVLKILGRYPIVLFGPPGLDVRGYLAHASKAGCEARYVSFPESYFADISGYSRLMLSADFYRMHEEYTHLLLYQLDAYVFSDELETWCSSGYDYIGAPWIEDKSGRHLSGALTGVGNGGFCLRNVDATLKVLSTKRAMKSAEQLSAEYLDRGTLRSARRSLSVMIRAATGWKNNGKYFATGYVGNEDAFWGALVPESRYPFNVAPVEAATRFSFEVAPRYLYGLNQNRLPFGCHAWFKYEPEFWRDFISW
jgi:hypothetical protein